MRLTLSISCRTREGALSALRTAHSLVKEFERLDHANMGDFITDIKGETGEWVLKWKEAPMIDHAPAPKVVVLKGAEKPVEKAKDVATERVAKR